MGRSKIGVPTVKPVFFFVLGRRENILCVVNVVDRHFLPQVMVPPVTTSIYKSISSVPADLLQHLVYLACVLVPSRGEFETRRVFFQGLPRVRKCSQSRGSSGVGSGHDSNSLGPGVVGEGVFKISPVGSDHPGPTRPRKGDLVREKPCFFFSGLVFVRLPTFRDQVCFFLCSYASSYMIHSWYALEQVRGVEFSKIYDASSL